MNNKRPVESLHRTITATIANGTAESGVIDLSDGYGSLSAVLVPGWTAANIGFKVCDTAGGTFYPLRDSAGALVQVSGIQTGSGNWYDLPDALNGVTFFKIWSQSGGVDANQGADRNLTVITRG